MNLDKLNSFVKQFEDNKNKKGEGQGEKKGTFEDLKKNYFNPVLGKDEKEGERSFRILDTLDESSPIAEAYFHYLKVGPDYKKLYCTEKNDGTPCACCYASKELYKKSKETGSETDKKLANELQAKKFYVVKVLEIGAEADGPKFYRFQHNFKGEGMMDKLIAIMKKKGAIYDFKTGRVLTVMLTKGGANGKSSVINNIDVADATDISTNEELMKLISEHTLTYKDVYRPTKGSYMQIVARQEVPVWSKEKGDFITKTEAEAANSNGSEEREDDGTASHVNNFVNGNAAEEETKAYVEAPEGEDDLPF